MEKQEINSTEYYAVDILHIVKTLWKRFWIIILSGLVAAAVGFSVSAFLITPTYSSQVKLYVNNSAISLGNTSFSISASEITAAQSLVKTYGEILDSRSTLERIIEKANVKYDWKELSEMITYEPSNGTEIMSVTVVSENPYEASKIANTIAKVLPVRISEIIDGATMEVVDSAVPETEKIAPSITMYTAVALFLGIFLSVVVLVIIAMLDDTIHDEEYVLKTYDVPILGKVPELVNSSSKSYGYYSRSQQR